MAILRGPLSGTSFKGHFSGHETFPVRYGWLKKVVDTLSFETDISPKDIFNPDIAIAHFGVGKNMVSSMKHWALVTGAIEAIDHCTFRTTDFGKRIFSDGGLDPFLEEKGTLWLLHWKIASNAERATTWFWAFNHFALGYLDRETLIREITLFCQSLENRRVTNTTIKRDIDCFFRTYLPAHDRRAKISEDSLECPLSELELIVPTSVKGGYEFRRGPQESLPDWVLNYAIADYWQSHPEAETISLETLAFEPGSPGQVFKLDEASMASRLSRIEDTSHKIFQWSDTAGMNQLIRTKRELSLIDLLDAPCQKKTAKAAA